MEQQLHKLMAYLASLYNLMHVTCQLAKLRYTQLTLAATVRCKRTKIDLVIKNVILNGYDLYEIK